jgi:hypothetical protein
MAKKASGSGQDAGSPAMENADAEAVFQAAPHDERGRGHERHVRKTPTFDEAYAEYFRSVCRGQRAQQVEMQRVWCDYVTFTQAAVVTHDTHGLIHAQKKFHEEWARVADPARFHESVRDAFDTYQQRLGHVLAVTDLTRLPPAALDALGRSVSAVAAHRMGIGG